MAPLTSTERRRQPRGDAGASSPPPALTEEVVVDLVKRAPAFAPSSNRTGLTVVSMMAIPGRQERGYFAEISWREGERFHGALLSIARADVELSSEMTWVVRHQQRGILHLEEDKTWQDLITSLENSQRTAEFGWPALGCLNAIARG